MAQEGLLTQLGQSIGHAVHAVVSILETMTSRADHAAGDVRTVQDELREADDAAQHDAQVTLDNINGIMTTVEDMRGQADLARQTLADWEGRAKRAADRAKKLPAGSPERAEQEQLVMRYLKSADEAKTNLGIAEAGLKESQADYDRAEQQLKDLGFTQEQIRSKRARLEISALTAQNQLRLAEAARNGSNNTAQAHLDDAQEKLGHLQARARAARTIANGLPITGDQAALAEDQATRDERVQSAFDALMGTGEAAKQ